MKTQLLLCNRRNVLLLTLFLLLGYHLRAQTLSFPGAEGFGRFATGGRGGDVYIVTNLNDTGPGSFRDAVSRPNRIVVFEVGGVIKITSRIVVSSNITIAGQTAPGEGIVIYGNGLSFSAASNTIVRYLRVRMGVDGDGGADAISIGDAPHDIIFDHLSVSWGRDETFSINGNASNITIQDCIIAQGLQTHSCGGLMQTPGGVSLFRNLYIDNNTRNPKVKGVNHFVNNVVYNWGVGGAYIMGDSEGPSQANIINNYYIKGPSSTIRPFSRGNENFVPYVEGNFYDDNLNGSLDGAVVQRSDYEGITVFRDTPYDFPMPATMFTAQQAYTHVLAEAGASFPFRDEVDRFLMNELTSLGTQGALIARETELPMGGPGELHRAPAPADTDRDGIPDGYETANGLNPNDAADGKSLTPEGYTNLEVYINTVMETTPPDFLRGPSRVTVTNVSPELVNVTWRDNSDDESEFILERSADGSVYTVLAALAANTVEYADETVAPNTTYFYRLKATNATQSSVYSIPVSIRTMTVPSAPAVPTAQVPANLATHVELDDLTLRWTGSENASGYKLFLGTDAANLEPIAEITTTAYVISGLAEDTTYYWRIDAFNDLGYTTGDVWAFSTLTVYPHQLVGDWRLNETTGTTVSDSSGYGHDGDVIDVIDFGWVPGKINNAIDIRSVNPTSGILIPHGDHLYFDKHSFTVSLWLKAPEQTTQSYLIHKGTFARSTATGATGKWFGIEIKDGNIRFAIDDDVTKSEVAIDNSLFFTDAWVHVVVMRDVAADKLRIYRNGALIAERNDNTNNGIGQDSPVVLANTNDFNTPFKGLLDEVKIFNYALPDSALLRLYHTSPLPLQALSPSPANGTQVESAHEATVSWRGGVNTSVYKLYFGTTPENLSLVADVSLADHAYTFTNLESGSTYFWRVDAVGSEGTATGEVWSFTTAFPLGLVGHWKLDETTGLIAADNSNYHHHAGITDFTAAEWSTDAKFGGSFLFKTPISTSAITIPHADHLLFDEHAFTVSLWVKIPSNTYTSSGNQDTYLFHKGTFEPATGKWYGLQLRNGRLIFAIDDGNTKTDISVGVTSGANHIFTNQWKHLVAVRDAASKQIRLYIDGAQAGSRAYTTRGIGRLTPLTLGNSAEHKPYRDLMDDVRLYNYALSETEVQAIFKGMPLVAKVADPLPAHASVVTDPSQVVLRWTGNAQNYRVFLGTSPDNLALLDSTLAAPTDTLSMLAHNTTYYWRVDATRDGETATGDVWSFTAVDEVPPAVRTKKIIVRLDSTGHASILPADVDDGTNDAYGIDSLTLDKATFDCSNTGPNLVTLTAVDNNGNTASATDTVIVQDYIAPVVLTRNITVPLNGNGEAMISAAQLDNGSYDVCGIDSIFLDKTVFRCADIGDQVVALTVIDSNGNASTSTATVSVLGAIPSLNIAVTRDDVTDTGADAQTIFLGYGAQQVTLEASDANAMDTTSFRWTPATGLSDSVVSNPVFTPVQEGVYTFVVTARNVYGCEAADSVSLHVIDARCGAGSDKVVICHKGRELCVSPYAVPYHLRHGDRIGKCEDGEPCTGSAAAPALSVSPNPISDKATIRYTVPRGRYTLALYNVWEGIERLAYGDAGNCGQSLVYEFKADQYRKQIYILVLTTEAGIRYERIVVR